MADEQPFTVKITREPYCDDFILTLPDGTSEELDPQTTRLWFKVRNANMDEIEIILDDVWNFLSAEVTIKNPRFPKPAPSRINPKI